MRLIVVVLLASAGCEAVFPLVAGPDAAAPFDLSRCPATYSLASMDGLSRYRLDVADTSWIKHHDDCLVDLPGATHLAAVDSVFEARYLQQTLDAIPGNVSGATWIGALQRRGQSDLQGGWIVVTGEDLTRQYWCPPNEPNDGADSIESGAEQFGLINNRSTCFADAPNEIPVFALCECDGKPVAPEATTLIDSYR